MLAMMMVSMVANAQVIEFTETAAAGTLDGKSFGSDGFTLTVTDKTESGKLSIDSNSQYFGTAESYKNYGFRLKTGGKSSSSNALTLSVPSAGTLTVCARSASSSDETRNIVFTQDGTELLNETLADSKAVKVTIGDAEKSVFPAYSCEVPAAGTIDVTYPVNGVNFYAFEFVAAGGEEGDYSPLVNGVGTVDITSDPENNYFSGYAAFSPSEVAAALGLDVAGLQALIEAGGAVYLKTADGMSNAYTGNTNEFWMNNQGVAQGYGDEGTCWYVGLSYDPGVGEDGETWPAEVDIVMGQMPDYFKYVYENSDLTCTIYLVNGDKQVQFNVTLHVNAAEKPELPDPVTNLSGLTIVKDYELPLNFTQGKSYEGKEYSATLDGIYDALGTTAAALDNFVADYTYTQVVKVDSVNGEAVYSYDDALQLPESAAGGGWFGRYYNYDEVSATETYFCNAPKTWGTGDNTFYVQSATLNDGEFSIVSGQYPGVLVAGDSDYSYLYIIYGDKAARVKVYVDVKEPDVVPFDQLVTVGELVFDVEQEANDNYSTKFITFDIADVLAKLGCESADDVLEYQFASDESFADVDTNDYWQNESGFSEAWSNSSVCCAQLKPYTLADGKFRLMMRPGRYTSITENVGPFPLKYALVYGSNLYKVTVNYTVTPVKEVDVEYTLKATEVITKQIVPASEYQYATTTQLDYDYISSILGTSDFVLYGEKYSDSEDYAETNGIYWDKNTNCSDNDEKGAGFWYGSTTHENVDHQVIVTADGWSSAASFGFQLSSSGVITWFQYPDARSVGDEYLANIYFVNEETGDYMKYILNVKYVEEETPEAETVGTEQVTVEATDDLINADGVYVVTIDMAAAYEALGITAADLDACTVVAPKSQFTFAEYGPEQDILYNELGYVTTDEDAAVTIAQLITSEGYPQITIDPMDAYDALNSDEPTAVVVRVGIEYDGKRYVHEITLANSAYITSINGVKTSTAASAIYSISGTKQNTLQKGINIVKYSDGTISKVYVK